MNVGIGFRFQYSASYRSRISCLARAVDACVSNKSVIFHVPGVIYKVSGGRLDIFSYKGEKPVENSPLFLAPFFNVTGSSVCLGNATLTPPEDMTFSKLLEYWEKRFWLSEFSHLGGNRNPTGSNLVSVTEKARANPFDENELNPMNKQLKDLLA